MTTQVERIKALEVRLENMEEKVDRIEDKLDELIALKYKGVGAFWLASTLMGTSIVGMVTYVISLLRGG